LGHISRGGTDTSLFTVRLSRDIVLEVQNLRPQKEQEEEEETGL